jgi:hypothetical protein
MIFFEALFFIVLKKVSGLPEIIASAVKLSMI